MDMVPYKIETERLTLRCYQANDAYLLHDAIINSIEHLQAWMTWAKGEPYDLAHRINTIRKFRSNFDADYDYVYGIFNKKEDVILGSTGFHKRVGKNALEIGYWINQLHTNKGYATEASKALTKVGFEILGAKRIEIHCDSQNEYSRRIPERLGYTLDATLKKRLRHVDGSLRDLMIWSMFDDDFRSRSAQKPWLSAYDFLDRPIIATHTS